MSTTLKRTWLGLGLALAVLVGVTIYQQNLDVDGANRKRGDEILDEWDKQTPSPSPTPSATASPTAPALPDPTYTLKPRETFAVVQIPTIEISFPLGEGVGDDVLDKGLGHYEKTAGPGQKGNFAVAGHVAGQAASFKNLKSVGEGDLVLVATKKASFVYRVIRYTECNKFHVGGYPSNDVHHIVRSSAIAALFPTPCTERGKTRKFMMLQTCWNSNRNPIRRLVFAEMVSAVPR